MFVLFSLTSRILLSFSFYLLSTVDAIICFWNVGFLFSPLLYCCLLACFYYDFKIPYSFVSRSPYYSCFLDYLFYCYI